MSPAQGEPTPSATTGASTAAPSTSTATAGCPQHVLDAIYGKQGNKQQQYENSLKSWWTTYAERRNDEEEHVADTLLYDKNHLPRTAPEPKWTEHSK